MSLLIDALKKAEKAKQEAVEDKTSDAIDFGAAIEAGSDIESRFTSELTAELTIEPPTLSLEKHQEVELEHGFQDVLIGHDVQAEQGKASITELTLEQVDRGSKDKIGLEPGAVTTTTVEQPTDNADLDDDEQPVNQLQAPAADGSSIQRNKDIEAAPLQLQSKSESYTSAPQTYADIRTSGQSNDENKRVTSPLGAPSIKMYRPGSHQRKVWKLAGMLGMAALVITGVSYYFVTALDSLSGSKMVVKSAAVALTNDTNPANDMNQGTESQPTDVQLQSEALAQSEVQQSVTESAVVNPTQQAVSTVNKPIIAAASIEPAASSSQTESSRPSTAVTKSVPTPQARNKNSNAQAVQSVAPLSIIKKQVVDPISVLLHEAYQHYQNNNYASAMDKYRMVLTRESDNRDALLGIAILAHRSQQTGMARQYYKKLLELNPKDSQAVAGMIALQSVSDSTQDESRLKLLIDQEPQAAHLYYALGNQYVNQGRWNEAQKAFFNAYHYDSNNADYVYNLAVSLDQLEQSQAALQYYRIALQLAQGKSVNFNFNDIAKRIQDLSVGAATSQASSIRAEVR